MKWLVKPPGVEWLFYFLWRCHLVFHDVTVHYNKDYTSLSVSVIRIIADDEIKWPAYIDGRLISFRGESLHWRHNGRDGVSNHHLHDCLLNRLFRRRSKKTSKLRVTGLCAGNSSVTSEFPAQRASNAENVSIWWRHHDPYHRLPITIIC